MARGGGHGSLARWSPRAPAIPAWPPSRRARARGSPRPPPTDPPRRPIRRPRSRQRRSHRPASLRRRSRRRPSAPTPPPTAPPTAVGELLDLGDAKPARDYDDFVARRPRRPRALVVRAVPGAVRRPVRAAGRRRLRRLSRAHDADPGLRHAEPTTYEEISQYSAFYCMQGDFMVYDDGEEGVLYGLAEEFGPSILGVVLAHEFGHAIQARTGDLDREPADDHDRAAGRLLRRRVGGPGGRRRGGRASRSPTPRCAPG